MPVKTILLVEDEVLIGLSGSGALRRNGFNVLVAANGEQALVMTRADRSIDLVMMDIHLAGGMDGMQAAHAILQERDLPLVFFTHE